MLLGVEFSCIKPMILTSDTCSVNTRFGPFAAETLLQTFLANKLQRVNEVVIICKEHIVYNTHIYIYMYIYIYIYHVYLNTRMYDMLHAIYIYIDTHRS